MSQAAALNRFLAEVEASAFRLARAAVGDQEEALDIVQDAMFTLARKYGRKPPEQWRPLPARVSLELCSRLWSATSARRAATTSPFWSCDAIVDPVPSAHGC